MGCEREGVRGLGLRGKGRGWGVRGKGRASGV